MSQDELNREILEFEELETQATQVDHSYTADDIQVLEGLEAVRLRPGMYIGSTSVRGLHHLVWEIVDNGIDEALAGFANRIDVTIEPNNIIAVRDNGRGMPVGIHEREKKIKQKDTDGFACSRIACDRYGSICSGGAQDHDPRWKSLSE